VADRFGEQLASLVQIIASVEQPVDFRAVFRLLSTLQKLRSFARSGSAYSSGARNENV
jgi:hypothetical protein